MNNDPQPGVNKLRELYQLGAGLHDEEAASAAAPRDPAEEAVVAERMRDAITKRLLLDAVGELSSGEPSVIAADKPPLRSRLEALLDALNSVPEAADLLRAVTDDPHASLGVEDVASVLEEAARVCEQIAGLGPATPVRCREVAAGIRHAKPRHYRPVARRLPGESPRSDVEVFGALGPSSASDKPQLDHRSVEGVLGEAKEPVTDERTSGKR